MPILKTKCIVKLGAYFIFSLAVAIFITSSVFSCFRKVRAEERERRENFKKDVEIKNSNPCVYEVVFTDGGKDTIEVWGDKIELRANGEDLLFRDQEVVLFYVPFRAYKTDEVNSISDIRYYLEKKLYNVVRFKKIKEK